ncbi:zinc finger and BTB domain-containing protein 7B [Ambystoma mexicanum]|uniref:zinc finger and BTB domain-containing protein 7B n=1 Tax=Ambystoma mexicanum TaxID=8296 RepID=UPI0037E87945
MGSPEDELIGIPFPEHSSDLLSGLNEQRHRGIFCDITLKTQGLEYRTHRAVLAACSHYFKKLFTSGSSGIPHSVCELDFLQPDALGALLEFAYTATLTISNSNMRDVLRAAKLLEIPCVVEACAEILQCSIDQPGTEASADADGVDYEKAERYLVEFAARQNGTVGRASPSPVPLSPRLQEPLRSIIPRRKKQHKFLQVKRSRPNNHILHNAPYLSRHFPIPMFDEDGEDDRSPPQEDREPSPLNLVSSENSLSYDVERAFDDRPTPPPLSQPPLPPLSPPDEMSDEDPMDLDAAGYINPLHDPSLAAELLDDKLVRKRRSQVPQECPVCHKIIHGAGKMPRHMRTHTGEKPFECEVCGVRFTRNDKLKIHMRKHTGERPYCCGHCSARFLHSYDLKNHMHLHTGDRPFECSLCHKAFAKEDHLQRHLKGQNCLEVRTRRRRKEEPTEVRRQPTAGLDLSNGRIEDFRMSMVRYWGLPRPDSAEGSPEGAVPTEPPDSILARPENGGLVGVAP